MKLPWYIKFICILCTIYLVLRYGSNRAYEIACEYSEREKRRLEWQKKIYEGMKERQENSWH